jgi:16S rRNA (adenine1518-N6/adenine1519-N6)-dimethyltransferase
MDEPKANKSLGQHWLKDETSLSLITQAADLHKNDVILEVGPGLGQLTSHLVRDCQQVIAVELDKVLASNLKSRVKANNLEVINQDILQFNFNQIKYPYKIVANLPYYLTSNFIRVISQSSHPPEMAVLLVQKEVAERLAAKPNNLSILGVTAQVYWQVSLGLTVPSYLFEPPPKVDSQLVILNYRHEPLFDLDKKAFFRIVKAGFSQKRKTLLNSLSSGLRLDKELIKEALAKAKIDDNRRAQTLSLNEWYQLYKQLN